MNGEELTQFLANPTLFLGDWSLDINIAAGTKTDKFSVKVASSSEDVEIAHYPAASNRVPLYISKEAARQTYLISANQVPQSQTKNSNRLPWASHKAYYTRLDDQTDLFATSRLNGCCVMICGLSDSPTVVHANRGDSEIEAVAASGGDVVKKQMPFYDKFYWDVMGRMLAQNILSSEHPVLLFDPGKYFGDGLAGRARVYGIRNNNGWTFYACIETSQTKNAAPNTRPVCRNIQIWPTLAPASTAAPGLRRGRPGGDQAGRTKAVGARRAVLRYDPGR